jgi:hypothetical protein
MRDIESIDSEPRLVAALRFAARERGGPLPSIDVADALLNERRGCTDRATSRKNDAFTRPLLHVCDTYSRPFADDLRAAVR